MPAGQNKTKQEITKGFPHGNSKDHARKVMGGKNVSQGCILENVCFHKVFKGLFE